MVFKINEFMGKMNENNALLRTNKFEMLFTPPPILTSEIASSRILSFYCQDAVLPGYQLMTGNVRRWGYGPNESRPFGPNFQQLQLLFNIDGDMKTIDYFNEWLESILPHNTQQGFNTDSARTQGRNYTLSYKSEYAVDLQIKVYDETGEVRKTYMFKEAFPSNINQVQLSWGDQNQVAQFTVFMEYLDWHPVASE